MEGWMDRWGKRDNQRKIIFKKQWLKQRTKRCKENPKITLLEVKERVSFRRLKVKATSKTMVTVRTTPSSLLGFFSTTHSKLTWHDQIRIHYLPPPQSKHFSKSVNNTIEVLEAGTFPLHSCLQFISKPLPGMDPAATIPTSTTPTMALLSFKYSLFSTLGITKTFSALPEWALKNKNMPLTALLKTSLITLENLNLRSLPLLKPHLTSHSPWLCSSKAGCLWGPHSAHLSCSRTPLPELSLSPLTPNNPWAINWDTRSSARLSSGI